MELELRWQDDAETNYCYLCHTSFNIINRRHHCRKCGKIVCGDCSGQNIKYFPRTMIVDNGKITRLEPNEIYRTCDNCVDEIRMIRRALYDNGNGNININGTGESSTGNSLLNFGHHHGHYHNNSTDNGSLRSDNSITKYSSRMMTRRLNSSHSSLTRDDTSDQNLCPICAKNLLDLHKGSKLDYEMFKESHINDCLTSFDFNLNHQRYEGNHPKNKMLVYNIPPIPEPKFESIIGSPDTIRLEHEGSGSNSNSNSGINVNVNGEYSDKDKEDLKIFGGIIGSLNSHSSEITENTNQTNTTIIEFDECVVCLEELKPGDKVGRLECLCVFHYKCIKDWFNKKGYGECPVHYLQK